jgi:hypothetical protein
VGAPVRDGRALSLTVRERWQGRPGYPYARAAGGWLARTGSLPSGARGSLGGETRTLARVLKGSLVPLCWRPDLRFLNTPGDRW